MATSAILTALAVPSRHAILSHLLVAGEQTATQCAAAVGITASNCSWHLRELARLGLAERADADASDGRKRPWRATITGIVFDSAADPTDALAQAAVRAAWIDEAETRLADYVRAEDEIPQAWRDAATISDFAVQVTAAELAEIGERIDRIVRPYIRATRGDAPADSRIAHVSVRGFVDPRFVAVGSVDADPTAPVA